MVQASSGNPSKDSTAETDKPEVNQIYEVFDHFLSTRFGIHIPFPSEDSNDLQNVR